MAGGRARNRSEGGVNTGGIAGGYRIVHCHIRDRNPPHYNEELARVTKFGGIVVQGGVTSAILNAVVAEKLPGPGTVFLHVDCGFKAPVRPGDKIIGAVEVTKVRTDKPITELKTTVTRDDGTVVLEGNALCYTMPLPHPAE